MSSALANSPEILEKEEFISPSLGDIFKNARTEKNLTLNDVSEELKIRRFFLQSIEDEKYEMLPGGVYTIGFIRSYAKYLGLNQEAIMEQLKELDFFGPVRLNMVGDEHSFPSARYVSSSMVILGVVILLVCSICAYLFLDQETVTANLPSTTETTETIQEDISEVHPAL
jgi:cytoskeletal protein RodZ